VPIIHDGACCFASRNARCAAVLSSGATNDHIQKHVVLQLVGGEALAQLGITLQGIVIGLRGRKHGGNDGIPHVGIQGQLRMLNQTEGDSVGYVVQTFLTNSRRALHLECLRLVEGKGGSKVLTSIVGIVTLCQLPKIFIVLCRNVRHLLSKEIKGICIIAECCGAIAHQNLAFLAVCIINELQCCIKLILIIANARLGNCPTTSLSGSPGLGKSHKLLTSAIIPSCNGDHHCHVLLAILQRSVLVKDRLRLVVIVAHESEVILQIVITLRSDVGGGCNEVCCDQSFLYHVVHAKECRIGSILGTSVMKLSCLVKEQEILTGLKSSYAKENACDSVKICTTGVVRLLT